MDKLKSSLEEYEASIEKDNDLDREGVHLRIHGDLLVHDYKLQAMIDGTSKVVELLESAIKDAAHGQVPAQLLNLSLTRGEIQNVLLAVSEIDVLGDTVNSKLKTAMLERGSMCVSFIETFIAEERKSQKIPNVPAGAHYVDCSTCFPPFPIVWKSENNTTRLDVK